MLNSRGQRRERYAAEFACKKSGAYGGNRGGIRQRTEYPDGRDRCGKIPADRERESGSGREI